MNLDIIIPVSMELDNPTPQEVAKDVLEQYTRYGFKRFALTCPSGGWRSVGYPYDGYFAEYADFFCKVKQVLIPYGIECGWWITATLKSGTSLDFTTIVKADGSLSPFANCPLDEAFRKRFSSDVATFAKIAKPAFIITEDDLSTMATGGCYCENHLNEFAKRIGKYYSREEVVAILSNPTEENIVFTRTWRELLADGLIGLGKTIREALDIDSPEIPMGIMQPGYSHYEDFLTERMARAVAGPNHTPFVRFYGAFYGGFRTKALPTRLFNPLYCKQHIPAPFTFYHESDTYPHTCFFNAAAEMRAMMGIVYSYGYDGSTFQTQQLLDNPNEESAFGKMFSKERDRFNALHVIASKSQMRGVEICYDPFYNTYDDVTYSQTDPLWIQTLSYFGIPYTTLEAPIAFWDVRQAKYADHDTIMRYLAKGLFLDGDAAKVLCDRGYSKYLGCDVGEVFELGMIGWDLGARDRIRDGFAKDSKGRNMPSVHMMAPFGNGKLRTIKVNNPNCEILSDEYTFQNKYIAPTMTRFENELGGHIVVMGMTLDRNQSQALFNYRRQKLFSELLDWAGASIIRVKGQALIFPIENRPIEPDADFSALLTLVNLGADEQDSITLILPQDLKGKKILALDISGKWVDVDVISTEEGIIINTTFKYVDPVYLLFK